MRSKISRAILAASIVETIERRQRPSRRRALLHAFRGISRHDRHPNI